MRAIRFLFSILGATLISTGVVNVHAAEGVFYDPSNAASPTGFTIGYELFRTIGCPGRELLGIPCPVPAPVPLAAMPEPAPAPAPAPRAAVTEPTPAPLAAVPEPAPAMKLVMEGVNFDFDKAVIRQEDIPKLDRDVATLKTWGDVNVEVAGHTCSIGTDAYNMGLSRRRAEAVRNYLISKGVSADWLTARGYGESQPVASNATLEGRVKNRRVELVPQR
ncbi:MAG TPA: OmpA family protein [Thiobacillus sp.]|nr:OmpA family protein [Thiobacillus sp.]